MSVKRWRFGELCVTRMCENASAPVLYVHGNVNGMEKFGWTVVSIEGIEWNRDLTPWPAKAVFRGQPDFGGGADAHLHRLTGEIMPAVEADLKPQMRIIAGYSLAGLFAVYAALETKLFCAAASVSGSMWYPDFSEYVRRKDSAPELAYFSVGDKEKLGRNAAFHSIEERTQEVMLALRGRGAETVFEKNPGGHFDNPENRMRRAADWLSGKMREWTIER